MTVPGHTDLSMKTIQVAADLKGWPEPVLNRTWKAARHEPAAALQPKVNLPILDAPLVCLFHP